jgi:nitrile hydratase
MIRVHDMGGGKSFAALRPEPNEPTFHHEWERRAFALTLAMGATGRWSIDMSRHARETLPPEQYLSSSYYEIWLAALLKLIVQEGLATEEEVKRGKSLSDGVPLHRLEARDVSTVLSRGTDYLRQLTAPPRFKLGDHVRAAAIVSSGHTRLPGYVQGRCGVITVLHGGFVFPDSHAHGKGEDPRWLYGVKFTADELWERPAADSVHVDCWEPYLEPA